MCVCVCVCVYVRGAHVFVGGGTCLMCAHWADCIRVIDQAPEAAGAKALIKPTHDGAIVDLQMYPSSLGLPSTVLASVGSLGDVAFWNLTPAPPGAPAPTCTLIGRIKPSVAEHAVSHVCWSSTGLLALAKPNAVTVIAWSQLTPILSTCADNTVTFDSLTRLSAECHIDPTQVGWMGSIIGFPRHVSASTL